MVGNLPKNLAKSFTKEVEVRLKEAQERKDNQRSAVRGADSHQRTPSFILSLLQNAISTVKNTPKLPERQQAEWRVQHRGECDKPPKGGLTDVGLHTGGKRRDTAWPLVCAILHVSFL
jgi:hypothetical protein